MLVVTNMYPPHHLGGYELSCRDVMRRWVAAGHTVTVLTTDFRLPTAGADEPGLVVHRDLQWYWRDHAFLRPNPLRRLRLERRNQRRLAHVLRETDPDVVSVWHLGGMSTALLSALAESGRPLVQVVCDEWPIYAPQVDPWMSSWLHRPRLARAARLITGVPTGLPDLSRIGRTCFVSAFLRDAVARATATSYDDADVVPSGIDLAEFPAQKRATGWRGHLLCVGRVEPRKGFATAVEALAELPEATLTIVGPAQEDHRYELERLAERLGVRDRMSFTELPRAELAARYAAADALLFTSTWQEPFGLVPLEAMAVGTPVIATGTGGSAEFLRDGVNCLLAAPGDADALAGAVRRLERVASLRSKLRRSGLETARQYTIDRYADELLRIHEKAMAA